MSGLLGKGVQSATGLSPFKHEVRQTLGTEKTDDKKKRRLRASMLTQGFAPPLNRVGGF